MHELSIAQSIVEQLEETTRAEGAIRVRRVTLTVGALSGVDPEALRLAYPVATEDTCAAGSDLVVEEVPSSVHCNACGQDSTPQFPFFVCETCGSQDVRVISGRELLISSVELET